MQYLTLPYAQPAVTLSHAMEFGLHRTGRAGCSPTPGWAQHGLWCTVVLCSPVPRVQAPPSSRENAAQYAGRGRSPARPFAPRLLPPPLGNPPPPPPTLPAASRRRGAGRRRRRCWWGSWPSPASAAGSSTPPSARWAAYPKKRQPSASK